MIGPWIQATALALATAGAEAPAATVAERVEVVARLGGDEVERARAVSLGRAELARLPAESLPEALAETGATVVLFAEPFGGTPMLVARGFFGGGETDYVTLDWDDLPLGDVESGAVDWHAVRLGGVERLELLAGPASRGAGELALAGAVSLEPRTAPGASAQLSVAGFGTRAAEAAWRGTPRGPWSASVAADATATDGYRDRSAAAGGGAVARLERTGARGRLRLTALGRTREREEPGPRSGAELAADPYGTSPLFARDRESTDRWAVAASWRDARAPVELRLAADGREASGPRTLLFAEGLGDTAHRDAEARARTLALRASEPLPLGARASWSAAVERREERAEIAYRPLAPGAAASADAPRRERLSGELRGSWRPTDAVELAATLRGDRIDDRSRRAGARRDEAFSPRLALLVRPRGERARLELFGEAGRAFRAPTLDQRYDPRPFPDFAGGTFTISNAALEPQRSRSWEAGAAGGSGAAGWRLLGYRMILADEIDFDPASFRYANLGRSRHEGIEASAHRRVGRASAVDAAVVVARAFAEGARRSGQLKNVPERLLRLGGSTVLRGGLELSLRATALGRRWADDEERVRLDDALLADLRVARSFGPLRLRLDLLNLLDEDAPELGFLLPALAGGEVLHGYPRAPRTARLGVEWSR